MSALAGRRVLLGVSGGIACYKTCVLARRLTEAGVEVDAVLTASAAEFVRPVVFEALTGRAVRTSLWEAGRSLDHVRLGAVPDLIVVAPATANLIARAAQGLADDFLSALLLARCAPLLICPAMNDRMFAHAETQANLALLRSRGVHVLGPDTGPLAEGDAEGPGRMVEPEMILAHVERLIRSAGGLEGAGHGGTGARGDGDAGAEVTRGRPLAGRRVLVTAGPTREPLDPIRVLTNRSSGRMGFALAREAWARGAEVTLIAGPTQLEPPVGVRVIRIETAADLAAAVAGALPDADVFVMAAAPADFRPASPLASKRRRAEGAFSVALEPTADVLAGTVRRRPAGAVVVGFALEAGGARAAGGKRASGGGRWAHVREKLRAKRLDLIVVNDALEAGAGPEVPTNRVTLLASDGGEEPLPLMSKELVAALILDRLERLVEAKGARGRG